MPSAGRRTISIVVPMSGVMTKWVVLAELRRRGGRSRHRGRPARRRRGALDRRRPRRLPRVLPGAAGKECRHRQHRAVRPRCGPRRRAVRGRDVGERQRGRDRVLAGRVHARRAHPGLRRGRRNRVQHRLPGVTRRSGDGRIDRARRRRARRARSRSRMPPSTTTDSPTTRARSSRRRSSRRGRRTACASRRAACSPNSASPCEMKRSNSAVAITGAGTPSSIAAAIVHRPSPRVAHPARNSSSVGRRVQRRRPSGRAATTRPRCRAATPRRPWRRRSRTGTRSGSRSGAVSASTRRVHASRRSAWCRMLRPSAYDAMSAYSMPLWTIFTKWPAPGGPQCRYPISSGAGSPVRPGVRRRARRRRARARGRSGRGARPPRRRPPIMRQNPRSRPQTPPLVPQSTKCDASLAERSRRARCRRGSSCCRRR